MPAYIKQVNLEPTIPDCR